MLKAKQDAETQKAQAAAQRQEERTARLAAIDARVSNAFRPKFEEIAAALHQQGIDAEVSYSPFKAAKTPGMRGESPRLSLKFAPPTKGARLAQRPYLELIFSPDSNEVSFFESTITETRGGHSGQVMKKDIDAVSGELIEDAVMKVIKAVYAP